MFEDPSPIAQFEDRMRFLARKMLGHFPTVRRWEETDDILQEASIRLHRALSQITPESELHWNRLAALQIRRVLLNLAAHHSSCYSFAANYETGFGTLEQVTTQYAAIECETDAVSLETWSEFHRAAGELPEHLQAAFDLIWYDGIVQPEAARILGVSPRTLQRHWRSACLELMRNLDGEFPE